MSRGASIRAALWAFAALALSGCSDGEAGVTRLRLDLPRSLDPSLVQSVAIAVIHEPSVTCVARAGSNVCADLLSFGQAKQAQGFSAEQILTRSSGPATATLSDLERGRTCFFAEARSVNLATLGVGCADVELELELHRIEILIE